VIGLAYTDARAVSSGFTDDEDADHARGMELATRALALPPQRAQAHWVYRLLLRRPRRLKKAAAAFERSIALDRNFAAA
jgi:hypothetical protein